METSPRWFVLYVKPRHEFLVADDLKSAGIEVFLPAVDRIRQWKDRKKLVRFPLFAGYLFARVLPGPEAFVELSKNRGVVRLLSCVPSHPTPVPDSDINALRSLVASEKELDIHPELREGKAIRIKRGIFKNVEGVISKKGQDFFLHINFALLGRSVSVKILADDVELV